QECARDNRVHERGSRQAGHPGGWQSGPDGRRLPGLPQRQQAKVVSEHQIIRPVRIDEAQALHELTQRSTMHWGYEPEFLEWEPEAIAVTPEFLENALASFALEEHGTLVGYYTITGTAEHAHLDKLFVDAPYIGAGRGKLLWNHAIATAKWL